MPTILSHPAVAIALWPRLRAEATRSLLIAGCILSIIPDADVIAFLLGIPYAHPLGHRGLSHSLLFAAALGGVAAAIWKRFMDSHHSFRFLLGYFFLCAASHGVLDAMTSGGRGVGFFIPFDDTRYFFPWRPIRVSPIGIAGFVDRGLPVVLSELIWIWSPALAVLFGRVAFARVQRRGR